MILLYSLIVSVILFALYYYINTNNKDKNEDYNENKEFFTINNFVIFSIIYVFIFSLLYLAFDDGSSLVSLGILTDDDYSKPNKITKSNIVDPSVLKNNYEPMKTGYAIGIKNSKRTSYDWHQEKSYYSKIKKKTFHYQFPFFGKCSKSNGTMSVLEGSHTLGNILNYSLKH